MLFHGEAATYVRVLVTGAAGFIGSHVAEALLAEGCEVVGIDALIPAAHRGPPALPDGIDYHRLDLRDPGSVEKLVYGVDAVSHQAAMVGLGVGFDDVTEYVAHNDQGTATLLRALARADFRGRFVLASSMVVYGEGGYTCGFHGRVAPERRAARDLESGRFDPVCPVCDGELTPVSLTEETPPDPRNVYAATKLHQEHLCSMFGRETDVPVAALRYHNVYGPRMPRDTPYAGVASIFRSALAARRPPEVFEDGCQLRDFVHVTDVARANVLCLLRDEQVSGPFNISSGVPHTIEELASGLSVAFGPDAPKPVVTGRFRLGDVRHIFAPPTKACDVLGFDPQITFDEGITDFAVAQLREGSSSP